MNVHVFLTVFVHLILCVCLHYIASRLKKPPIHLNILILVTSKYLTSFIVIFFILS